MSEEKELVLPPIPEEIRRQKSIMPLLRVYLEQYMSEQRNKGIITRAHDAAMLREKFHALCEEIELSYYVELAELPKGNFALMMSEFPLTAESAEIAGIEMPAELQPHEYEQHTFVADGRSKDAMWGVFTLLTSFMYYEVPPRWRRTLPNWHLKKRVCPILFVSASDGLCELAEREFRRSRLMPDVKAALEAVKAYQVSMLAEVLDDNQMLTEQVDRADRKIKRYQQEKSYDEKQELEYLLSRRERGVNVSRDKGLNISLFSSKALRYFFYILALVGLIFLIYYFGSAILYWLTGTGGDGGGGGTTTTTTGVIG